LTGVRGIAAAGEDITIWHQRCIIKRVNSGNHRHPARTRLRPMRHAMGGARSRILTDNPRPATRHAIPVSRPLLPVAERLLPYLRFIDAARYYTNFGPQGRRMLRAWAT
jgi:hypothetical protein